MRVSVVVLVYKNIDILKRTLCSIAAQDYPQVEVLLSDDGSPNVSIEALESAFRDCCADKEFSNIIINQNDTNMGLVAHFNKMLKMASGDIILPLSCGDAFYHNEVLSDIAKFFEAQHCMIATGKRSCFLEETGEEIEVLPTEDQIAVLNAGGQALIDSLCRGNFISGACTAYSKELFRQYGYLDERFFLVDDYPNILRWLMDGQKVFFLDMITIRYQLSGVSSKSKRSPLFENDMKSMFQFVYKPNRAKIGHHTYRYIHCREIKERYGILIGAIYSLVYPDVVWEKLRKLIYQMLN